MNNWYKNTYNISKKTAFGQGLKDGIPIALGYFAVAFSLGIIAKTAGLTPFQGFISSALNRASAGEYAIYTLIAAGASYVEVAIMTLVCNARYMLMSTALSQKVKEDTPLIHRVGAAFGVTDEIFAISISRPGYLNPYYNYGAISISTPAWALGTSLGIVAGEIMPVNLVSAFSVALYGMFLAVIMPAARKNRVVAITIIICFILSYLASVLPITASISEGTRTIILTVVIASVVAILCPRPSQEDDADE
ncbi:MAG: AzlC family ABC transporter permease [Pseudobutyrivibrio sp.]|nr:AzlC family ABC transporter permease [Pseudobutyrivibrio sp.]